LKRGKSYSLEEELIKWVTEEARRQHLSSDSQLVEIALWRLRESLETGERKEEAKVEARRAVIAPKLGRDY